MFVGVSIPKDRKVKVVTRVLLSPPNPGALQPHLVGPIGDFFVTQSRNPSYHVIARGLTVDDEFPNLSPRDFLSVSSEGRLESGERGLYHCGFITEEKMHPDALTFLRGHGASVRDRVKEQLAEAYAGWNIKSVHVTPYGYYMAGDGFEVTQPASEVI